jgi:hypothetical protein
LIGPDRFGYEIVFVAGSGPMFSGAPWEGEVSDALEVLEDDSVQADEQVHGGLNGPGAYHSTTGLDSTHEDMGGAYTGGGAARITPVPPGNCATVAVSEFEVAGFFVLAEL